MPAARPPVEVIDATTEPSAVRSRPDTTTAAPSSAKRRADAAPMPRDPPVTTTTSSRRSGKGSVVGGAMVLTLHDVQRKLPSQLESLAPTGGCPRLSARRAPLWLSAA